MYAVGAQCAASPSYLSLNVCAACKVALIVMGTAKQATHTSHLSLHSTPNPLLLPFLMPLLYVPTDLPA